MSSVNFYGRFSARIILNGDSGGSHTRECQHQRRSGNSRVRFKLSLHTNFAFQAPVLGLLAATHQLCVTASPTEPTSRSAVGHPDVDPTTLDDSARVVREKTTVLRVPEEQVHLSSKWKETAIDRDDPVPHGMVAAREALQAVRGDADRDPLSGARALLDAAEETAFRRQHPRKHGVGQRVKRCRHRGRVTLRAQGVRVAAVPCHGRRCSRQRRSRMAHEPDRRPADQ